MANPPSFQRSVLPSKYIRLSFFVMLALLLLASFFYQERAWFLDIAYQTVLMINEGAVQVQVNRFGAAIVQLLPLAAIKIGLPLTAVSLLYSISFPLLYLCFFTLVAKVFRQTGLAVAMALLYTAMVFDGFFWCTSELQQGLGFLLVFWAFLLRFPALHQLKYWLFIIPGIVGLVFYHPLVFIPFLFIWVYYGYTRPAFRTLPYGIVAGILLLTVFIKGHFFPNWYDAAKMTTFKTNLETYFPNYFNIPAVAKFLSDSILYWWGFPLLLLINTIWFSYRKQWFLVLIIWGASIGFVLLNAIGAPQAAFRFYSEVNYYPLILFVAIPFCDAILPKIAHLKYCWWGVLLFFTIRIGMIGFNHQAYTDRLHWLDAEITKAKASNATDRYIRWENSVPIDTLIMTWGTPFESLLISASQGSSKTCTYLITNKQARFPDSLRQQSDLFLMDFYTIPIKDFNQQYFQFEDNRGYHLLPAKK